MYSVEHIVHINNHVSESYLRTGWMVGLFLDLEVEEEVENVD